jgi:hypothetical protein
MKLSSAQHRVIQAVLSLILIQIAVYQGDWLKLVVVVGILTLAWGLLLTAWLIDWANAQA